MTNYLTPNLEGYKINPIRFFFKITNGLEKVFIVALIPLIVLLIYLSFWNDHWSERFDLASTLIGLIPLVPIIAIWFMGLHSRWLSDLPTYLTINLKDDNGAIAKFECIHSLTDSDLRGHAQSLLSSLVSGGRVSNLELFIRSENYQKGSIFIDESKIINQGNPFEFKEITLQLTENIIKSGNHKYTSKITLKSDHIWYWLPEGKDKNKPYIKEPTQILLTELENN